MCGRCMYVLVACDRGLEYSVLCTHGTRVRIEYYVVRSLMTLRQFHMSHVVKKIQSERGEESSLERKTMMHDE